MATIVSGNALGLSLGSLASLGARGGLGSAATGRNGELAYVNAATGNLVLQDRDGALVGRGFQAGSTRTYNSQGLLDDDNGDNWSSGFYRRQLQDVQVLVKDAYGNDMLAAGLSRTDRDGATSLYLMDPARGRYVSTDGAGAHDTIDFDAGNQYVWTDGDTGAQEIYSAQSGFAPPPMPWSPDADDGMQAQGRFAPFIAPATPAGRLLSTRDANGNTLSYDYNSSGLIASVTTGSGETMLYRYTGNDLTEISTFTSDGGASQMATRVHYQYDSLHRLAQVTVDLSPLDGSIADGNVYSTAYTYVDSSRLVASVTQSDGSGLNFTYVTVGGAVRVASVQDALGHRTGFTYDTAARRTTVTDPLGLVSRFDYDPSGQLVAVTPPTVDGVARPTTFSYTANGDVAKVVDGNGAATTMAYDSHGNLVLQRDAIGNTVTRSFDAIDRLLTETTYTVADPDGAGPAQPGGARTTRYVYAFTQSHQPRFVVTPEGRVTEYRYDGYGARVATLEYAAAVYDLRGLAPLDVPSEAQMSAWAAAQDRARTSRTDFAYDFRGQLKTSTRYASLDAAGNGVADGQSATTNFVYDAFGQLIKTVSASSGATTFTYDGLGRQLSQTDALGHLTLTRYDDANAKTTVTLANGLATTTAYDTAGRVVAVQQGVANGASFGATHYTYDADSRLVMSEDPTGVRAWVLYDNAGRKVADIDGNGTLTEYAFDGAGRLTRTIVHAAAVNTTPLVNGAGEPALPSLDALRPAPSANDRTTWRCYDAAGRLTTTIGADGSVIAMRYDGASQLVGSTAYATRVATAALGAAPAAAAIVAAPSAEDRSTRNVFDGDGSLLATLDAEGYLAEHQYDGAGRLVAVIRYATATPVAMRANGALDALRPAASATDRREVYLYNAKGQLAASVDAENGLTENVYDVDGHLQQVIRYANRVTASVSTVSTLAALRPAASAEDHVSTSTYDALGRVTRQTIQDGTQTRFFYDGVGNLVATVKGYGEPDARASNARFDLQGRLVGELSGEGSALLSGALNGAQIDAVWAQYGLAHTYDAAGRRTSTVDPNGNRTVFFYDAEGRLVDTVNALGEVQERRYDALGQLTGTVRHGVRIGTAGLVGGLADASFKAALAAIADAGADSRTTITYNTTGTVAATSDALGNATTATYNAFGELTAQTTALDATHTRSDSTEYDHRGLAITHAADTSGAPAITRAVYDAFGRATQTTDANGHVDRQVFDRLGRTVQRIDAGNAQRSTTYDAFDRVLSQTDATGQVTRYAYDSAARAVTVTSPEGVATTTTFTRDGQTRSVTDGNGGLTTYTYDHDGRLTSTATPLAITTSGYDRAGRLVKSVDGNGARVDYSYDAAGRVLTRLVDPNGLALVTTYAYDAKGEQVSVTDPLGVVTAVRFDLDGNQVSQTVVVGGVPLATAWSYDAGGQVLSMTDPSGVQTRYTYDALGRRTAEVADWGGLALARSYSYDPNGNVTSAVDAGGHTTRYVYDALDRLVFTVDPAGGVTRIERDAEGREVRTTHYAGAIDAASLPAAASAAQVQALIVAQPGKDAVDIRRYDRDGRARFSVDGSGAVTQFGYDGNGNVVSARRYANPIALANWNIATDPPVVADAGRDQLTRTTYDALNRVTFSADALGHVTGRRYDAAGQVLARVDYATAIADGAGANTVQASAADRTTRFAYDAAGRQVLAVDALGGVTERGFDLAGGVAWQREYAHAIGLPANGSAAQNDALSASQIRAALQPDGAVDRTTRYTHDAAGRLAFTVDAMGAVTRDILDANGRVVAHIAYANTVGAGAAPESVSVSGADQVTRYAYDAAGRQILAVDALGVVTGTAYFATGQLSCTHVFLRPIVLPSGASLRDPLSEAQMRSTLVGDGPNERDVRYTFDAAGRVLEKTVGYYTAAVAVTTYRYDALGHVTAEVESRGHALAFDNSSWAQGERGRLGFAADANALTDAQRQTLLDRYTTSNSYDAAGRRIATRSPTGATSTAYDAFGNAIAVTDPLGNTGRFYFDKLGRVTVQIDPEGYTTQTVYTAGFDAKVQSVVRYAMRVAPTNTATPPTLTPSASDATTRYTYDRTGRVLTTTDATGFVEGVEYGVAGNRFDKRVTNKLGGVAVYTYDRDGREIGETLPVQSKAAGGALVAVVNSYAYDAFGNRVQSIEAAGLPEQRTTTFRYDADNRVTHRIGQPYVAFDAGTQASTVVTPVELTRYNAFGDAVETVVRAGWDGSAAQGGERTLHYFDGAGNAIGSIGPDGAAVALVRDPAGHVVRQIEYATWVALPAAGGGVMPAPAASADNDRVTDSVYDAAGRLTLTQRERVVHWEQAASSDVVTLNLAGTQPDTVTLQQSLYDANGNVVQQIDGRGNSVYNYYDKIGRRTLSIDAEGYATAWDYADLFDTATKETRYSTRAPAFARQDDLGAAIGSRDPVLLRATLDAQANGADRVTTRGFDRAGRIVEARVKNVAYDYVDGAGNTTHRVSDAVTEYNYDGLGNVTQKRERVAELADGATRIANTTDIVYDQLGRETDRRLPGYLDASGVAVRPATHIDYDGLGDVVRTIERGTDDGSETDDHITAYRYNSNGDRTQVTDALGNVTRFDLDARGRIARTTTVGVRNADGAATDVVKLTQYDAAGRAAVQIDAGTGDVRKTAYNAFGDISATGQGDGWQEFIQYNTLGKVQKSNTGDGVARIYLYDANGNATRQITSGTTDLTTMSVVAAATDTTLLHTFSSYDKRNELVRTVEPDISFMQDQVSMQGAFSQQLAPLYGLISVGNSAGGTYAQGSVAGTSYTPTPVQGSAGASAAMVNPPAAPSGNFGVTYTTNGSVRSVDSTGAFGVSIAWEGSKTFGGTTKPAAESFTLPSDLPPYTYRLVSPNGTVTTLLRGNTTTVADSDNGYTSLQFNPPGTGQWVEISQLRCTCWHEETNRVAPVDASVIPKSLIANPDKTSAGYWEREFSSTESNLVFVPQVPNVSTTLSAFINDAFIANAHALYDKSGVAVAGWYAIDSLQPGTTSVTVRLYDGNGSLLRGDRLSVAIGDGAKVTPAAINKTDVWAEVNYFARGLHFDGSKVGASATIYIRPLGSGNYASYPLNGRVFDIAALGLQRGASYEFIVDSGGVETHSQFVLDGDGIPQQLANGGLLQTMTRAPRVVTFDLTNKLSSLGAPSYTFELLIGGQTISRTIDGASRVTLDTATDLAALGISRYANASYDYSYRVYGERGGVRQFVGQGSGNLTLGIDCIASNAATQSFVPTGTLALPGNVALTGVLSVGPQNGSAPAVTLNIGDWRRTTAGQAFAIDMSQWMGGGNVSVNYEVANTRFAAVYQVEASGRVTQLSVQAFTRQPNVAVTVAGAARLSVLKVGGPGVDKSAMADVSMGLVTTSGSLFTWDATAQSGAGPRRFYYEAVNGAGVVVGKGYGNFTLATDGSLVSSMETPDLLPSAIGFAPPAGTTSFQLSMRPSGSAGPYALYTVSPSFGQYDVSGLRSNGGPTGWDYKYLATDAGGAILSSGAGVLTVNVNGSTATSGETVDRKPTIVTLQGPPGKNVSYLQIDRRPQGASSAYSTVGVVQGVWDPDRKISVFTWNVSDLVNGGDTAPYDFVLRMQNADRSAMRNEVGEVLEVKGVMTLGGSASAPLQMQQYVTQFVQSAQVKHMQTFNAFGEVASEYDDRVYARMQAMVQQYGGTASAAAAQTEFTYNALGKLTAKTDAETNIVLANGYRYRARPVTTYGYDLGGRTTTLTDANGNTSKQTYAGEGERVAAAWAADGGRKSTGYDVFGSARKLTDELGYVTLQNTDALGQLTQVQHLGVSRVENFIGADAANAVASTLTDSYAYDALGRRIAHTNTLGWTDKTDYDSLGRVTRTVSAAGRATVYTYNAVAAGAAGGILGAGGKNIGGYQLTTSGVDGRSTVDRTDYFGRTTWHQDLGGRTYSYNYDIGGRLASQTSSAGQNLQYRYYANGDIAEAKDLASRTMSKYGYDNAGNRVLEAYGGLDAGNSGIAGFLQSSTISYDELNRINEAKDVAYDVRYDYDAVGNRRAVRAVYWDPTTLETRKHDELWYTYDAVNRFTTSKGSFVGSFGTSAGDTRGGIVIGPQGVQLGYDLAGQRASATNADGSVERYSYTAEGYLQDTTINGTLRARRRVDSLGRTLDYKEWEPDGLTYRQEKQSVYDRDNRLQQDTVSRSAQNGITSYAYFNDGTDSQAGASASGSGALARADYTPSDGGARTSTTYTYQYWDGAKQTGIQKQASTEGVASWAPGVSQLSYDVNGYLKQARDNVGNRTLNYTNNATGLVLRRDESSGSNTYTHSWYYAAGQRIGDVTTDPNDTYRVSYAEALAVNLKDAPSDKDRFKNFRPATSADFDQNYEPINASYPGATATSYTVRTGDTLKTIAQSLWGDASMWYLIAQQNSLSGNETLKGGQVLAIPNKVTNIHNNSTTIRPYTPGEVIGHVDPTLPSPAAPAAQGKHGCGGLGTIIMIVVAVAVTVYTAGAAAGWLGAASTSVGATGAGALGGAALTGEGLVAGSAGFALGSSGATAFASAAIGGAVGSVASQAVGMAIGNVDSFSWKAVAQSAIGAGAGSAIGTGVNAALQGSSLAAAGNVLEKGSYARAAVSAGAASAATQAMQGKWSWREVAASSVGSAAGAFAGSTVREALAGGAWSQGAAMAGRFAGSIAAGWASEQVKSIDSNYTAARLSTMYAGAVGGAVGGSLASGSGYSETAMSTQEDMRDAAMAQATNSYSPTSVAQDLGLSMAAEQRLQTGQTFSDAYGSVASFEPTADASGSRLRLSVPADDPRVLELQARIQRLTALEQDARELVKASSTVGDPASAFAANASGFETSLSESIRLPTVEVVGRRMTADEAAAYDAEQSNAELQQATDAQVIAGTYNKFSSMLDSLRDGDYSQAWWHLNAQASDAAKAATHARLFPQQSPEMARVDRMLASPIGASASVIGRLFGASEQRQDALLATGSVVEQLAGAGTGIYKQTLTATAPLANALSARPRPSPIGINFDAKPAGVPYEGPVYRLENPARVATTFDVHAGNIAADHRYSAPGAGAVYGSTSPGTAHAEVAHYGLADGRVSVTKDVTMRNVLDLTNPAVRNELNVTLDQISGNSYVITHQIGKFARNNGYEAILAPSARDPNGSNLVIFPKDK